MSESWDIHRNGLHRTEREIVAILICEFILAGTGGRFQVTSLRLYIPEEHRSLDALSAEVNRFFHAMKYTRYGSDKKSRDKSYAFRRQLLRAAGMVIPSKTIQPIHGNARGDASHKRTSPGPNLGNMSFDVSGIIVNPVVGGYSDITNEEKLEMVCLSKKSYTVDKSRITPLRDMYDRHQRYCTKLKGGQIQWVDDFFGWFFIHGVDVWKERNRLGIL